MSTSLSHSLRRRLSAGVVVCKRNHRVPEGQKGDFSVLLVRRSAKSSFMPNTYVFPGGKVDAVDETAAFHARNVGFSRANNEMFKLCASRRV
jgi:8-oxo-dGTP pyrophosphatase MutT (NUDIX family)